MKHEPRLSRGSCISGAAAGNLTQWGDPTAPGGPRGFLAYNEGNRLATFSRLPGVLASYSYNAHGQRVRKTGAGGVDTFTVYAPDGRWLGDFNASGGAEQLAIWLDDLPVGLITGNGSQARLQYIQADALGTPRAVIDPQRNVAVWHWDALGEAFGRDYPTTDPDGDGVHFDLDMRFPGQRFDAETGFHYNYYRDYDPATGRYTQSDPIGLAGGMSTYGYANGAPGVYSDPEGLAAMFVGRVGLRVLAPRVSVRAITTRLGVRSMLDPALRAAYKEAALKRALKRQAARLARNGGKTGKPNPPGCTGSPKGPVHHICTDKNCTSIARGGPWTPRFEAIFQKAGMRLNDGLNKVVVPGHKGPHPEAYHQAVFRRLESATSGLTGAAYRDALRTELQVIGRELQTPGSILNLLVRKP